MSLKGFLKQIVFLGTQFSLALKPGHSLPVKQIQAAIKVVERRVLHHIFYRNRAIRLLQKTFIPRNFVRTFSVLHYRNVHHLYKKREFNLWKHNQSFSPLDRIRNIFISNPRYNESIVEERYPENLEGYEIGPYIAHGCNAAVYSLQLDGAGTSNGDPYPLALKIMFNYDYSLPERYIWEGMGTELVPLKSLPKNALVGHMRGFKPMKRQHPNIIKLHTAFIDLMPELKEAAALFEEATPSLDNFGLVYEPKTLFVVMKRYRTTLREYSLRTEMSTRKGQVLFGQLLEALVCLNDHGISHRDMKSDNILLNYDYDDEIPHLVLSDFGSALVSGFKQTYIDEFTDLGGNIALRAPEISRCDLRPGQILDYSKADLWSAGAIGYEMFGQQNPFYSRYSSRTYEMDKLPLLPALTPNVISKLIRQLLKIDPSERPNVKLASNVVVLSLFSLWDNIKKEGEAIMKDLVDSKDKNNVVDMILTLFAAETFTARSSNNEFHRSELQLRATFFSRVGFDHIYQSLLYFENKTQPN